MTVILIAAADVRRIVGTVTDGVGAAPVRAFGLVVADAGEAACGRVGCAAAVDFCVGEGGDGGEEEGGEEGEDVHFDVDGRVGEVDAVSRESGVG